MEILCAIWIVFGTLTVNMAIKIVASHKFLLKFIVTVILKKKAKSIFITTFTSETDYDFDRQSHSYHKLLFK
jgi:hypothetical protein